MFHLYPDAVVLTLASSQQRLFLFNLWESDINIIDLMGYKRAAKQRRKQELLESITDALRQAECLCGSKTFSIHPNRVQCIHCDLSMTWQQIQEMIK